MSSKTRLKNPGLKGSPAERTRSETTQWRSSVVRHGERNADSKRLTAILRARNERTKIATTCTEPVRFESCRAHQKGKIKRFWFASLRSAANLYSILGVKTNSRFRILGEENFLILSRIQKKALNKGFFRVP